MVTYVRGRNERSDTLYIYIFMHPVSASAGLTIIDNHYSFDLKLSYPDCVKRL